MDSVYIIMPAYNEEQNIEKVVNEWHEIAFRISMNSRLVVIDDGSKDNTYRKLQELTKKMPCLEIVTKANSGHGSTVLWGYNYALAKGADYIFQTDSDGQTVAKEFWDFWDERTRYSAIIGYRKGRQDGFKRVIVTKVLKACIRIIFGIGVTDANTPFRLMNNEILKRYIDKIPRDYNLPNVMLTVFMVMNKEKIVFKPITFKQRQGGKNSINMFNIIKIGRKAVSDFKKIKKENRVNLNI